MKYVHLFISVCIKHKQLLNTIIDISLTCPCIHIAFHSFMVYIICESDYTFSLGQYWENSPVGGDSSDCIESMDKILCIPEFVS